MQPAWRRDGGSAPAGPASLSRWGQLTYTSLDRGGAAGGGWQVKETRGDLTQAEQDLLRSRVSTQFESREPVPAFPSPDDVARLPRRLCYQALPDGTAAYWHTVPAGVDGSGRPGNVFAHTVLDRRPAELQPALRPISLWRSADWLTPFGADQVSVADLHSDLPAAGPLQHSDVVRFLLDGEYWGRLSVLSGLLDAMYARTIGGAGVVLGVRSPDTAATWIAAISAMVSAQTSRRWSFSTLERPATLIEGVDLSAVAREDLADLDPARGWVVIDEDELVDVGVLDGQPHRTAAGSPITVTRLSTLADLVLADEDNAVVALGRLDALTGEIDEPGLDPAWPLAMVVADQPDLYGQAMDVAADVLRVHSPRNLRWAPEMYRAAAAAVSGPGGNGAAAAFALLQPLDVNRSGLADQLEHEYLHQMLDDGDWLVRGEAVPLPHGYRPATDPDLSEHANRAMQTRRAAVERAAGTSPGTIVPTVVVAMRLMDVVLRAELDDPVVLGELARAVVPALLDPGTGPEILRRSGAVDPALRSDFLVDEIKAGAQQVDAPLGARLPPEVMSWVLASPGSPGAAAPMEPVRGVSVFDAELAAAVAAGTVDLPSEVFAGWRYLGLWLGLTERRNGRPVAFDLDGALVAERPGRPGLTSREAALLYAQFRTAVPLRAVFPALYGDPWSDSLRDLIVRLAPLLDARPEMDAAANHVEQLIKLRKKTQAVGWWSTWGTETGAGGRRVSKSVFVAKDIIGTLAAVLEPRWQLAPDAIPSVLCAFALAAFQLDGQTFPLEPEVLDYLRRLAEHPAAVDAVTYLQQALPVVQNADIMACTVSICARPGHPCPPNGSLGVVAALTVGTERIPLVDTAIRAWQAAVPEGEYLHGLQRDVGVNVDSRVKVRSGSRERDRDRQESAKIEKEWWRDMRGRSSRVRLPFGRKRSDA